MTDSFDERTEPRRAAADSATTGDPTSAATDDGVEVDGSTVIARRESRRRHERAGALATAPRDEEADAIPVAAASGRAARAPDVSPASSPVRSPEPVVVRRAAPRRSAPQPVVDAAAGEATRRRRSRTRVAVVLVAGGILVIAASTALVILLTMG